MIPQIVLFAFLSTIVVSHPIESEIDHSSMNKSVISKSLGDFSLKIFKVLDSKDNPNIIFSPFGIHNLFSMLTHGAGGETKKQLIDALQLSEEELIKVADEYEKILTHYQSINKDEANKFMLHIGNMLMANSHLTLKDEFKSKLITSYLAEVYSEDFSKGEEVTQKINDWVKDKTHDKIQKLLDESIPQDALLVLANAVYFKGNWKDPFVSYHTKKSLFYKDDEHSYEVKMMSAPSIEVKYVEDKDAKIQVVALPYEGNVTMYILLPHERTGLQQIKKDLTSDKIKDLMSRLTSTHLKLEIPKFQATTELNLNLIFSKIGVTLPFENSADFSGISDHQSKISKSIQKTIITVDEKGTEAAAASSAISVVRASIGDIQTQFIADHPFLFMIHDDKSRLPLFAGEVKMPKAFSDYPPEPENQ